MKLFIFLLSSVLYLNAQNPYQSATLTFRDGTTIDGEVKILLNNRTIKFREDSKSDKIEYNYLKVKEVKIVTKTKETEIYKYKIVVGKKPLLFKVIKEYDGIINLYALHYNKEYGVDLTISENVYEFYVNKGSGDTVIKLGTTDILSGKRHFKKTVKKFFEDCPKLIKKVEDKEFKRNRSDIEAMIEYYYNNCAT